MVKLVDVVELESGVTSLDLELELVELVSGVISMELLELEVGEVPET